MHLPSSKARAKEAAVDFGMPLTHHGANSLTKEKAKEVSREDTEVISKGLTQEKATLKEAKEVLKAKVKVLREAVRESSREIVPTAANGVIPSAIAARRSEIGSVPVGPLTRLRLRSRQKERSLRTLTRNNRARSLDI